MNSPYYSEGFISQAKIQSQKMNRYRHTNSFDTPRTKESYYTLIFNVREHQNQKILRKWVFFVHFLFLKIYYELALDLPLQNLNKLLYILLFSMMHRKLRFFFDYSLVQIIYARYHCLFVTFSVIFSTRNSM